MSTFLKTLFLPVANRHFTDKKTSFIVYMLARAPATIGLILFAAAYREPYILLFPAGLIVFSLVDYFLFDAVADKLTWKLFWSHFYSADHYTKTEAHDAIKAFEKNPTEENRKAVERHIIGKQ